MILLQHCHRRPCRARCDVMQLTRIRAAPPLDCNGDDCHAFTIGLQTTTGAILNGTTQNYGDRIDLGGFRCTFRKSGKTCPHPAGHGFAVAKAGQNLFLQALPSPNRFLIRNRTETINGFVAEFFENSAVYQTARRYRYSQPSVFDQIPLDAISAFAMVLCPH